jgi:Excreted virulence factor EspC, type VII ESX diderm
VPADELAGPPATGAPAADLAVHRDVLRSVAARLRSDLAGLDAAVTRVQAAGAGVGSLRGWAAGDVFGAHVTTAHEASLQLARDLAGAHHTVAANLSASADRYDAAEADSARAVQAIATS